MSGRRPRDAIDRLRRYVQCELHGTNDKEVCYLLSTYLLTYILYIHTASYYCTYAHVSLPFPPPATRFSTTAHSITQPAANTTLRSASCAQPILLPRQRGAHHTRRPISAWEMESLRGRLLGAVRREVMCWERDVSQSVVREQ